MLTRRPLTTTVSRRARTLPCAAARPPIPPVASPLVSRVPGPSRLHRLAPAQRDGAIQGLQSRAFSSTAVPRSMEDLTNIIYSTPNDPVSITSVSAKTGFILSDGLVAPSPILLLDGQCFLWDVGHPTQEGKDPLGLRWDGWSVEKLKVFETLSPRPDLVLFGTGSSTQLVPPECKKYLNRLGIQVDVLDSRNAAATYNLLQEEGRRVAAALYPLSSLSARTGLMQ